MQENLTSPKEWSKISRKFPGRTQHHIKNRFICVLSSEFGYKREKTRALIKENQIREHVYEALQSLHMKKNNGLFEEIEQIEEMEKMKKNDENAENERNEENKGNDIEFNEKILMNYDEIFQKNEDFYQRGEEFYYEKNEFKQFMNEFDFSNF